MRLMFGALSAADPSRPAPQKDLLSLENPDVFEPPGALELGTKAFLGFGRKPG